MTAPMMTERTILMLAFPGAQILDITGPLQMFAAANDEIDSGHYRVEITAPRPGPFVTSSGMQLIADLSFDEIDDTRLAATHTLMVAGGDEGVRRELERGVITTLVRRAPGLAGRVASVCTGALVLAAAGLLDGRRATTHWQSVDILKRMFPRVQVDGDAIHIRDGDIWTSAGVTAGIDLALAMIEADHGRDVSLALARRHVVFRIRPGGQCQFSTEMQAQFAADDRLTQLAEKIAAEPAADWRTESLAAEANVSIRTLTRLFRRSLDMSPAKFVERVRVDKARRALVETPSPVTSIAEACGFGTLRRMDRAFDRAIATTPSAFRARFKA